MPSIFDPFAFWTGIDDTLDLDGLESFERAAAEFEFEFGWMQDLENA